MHTDADNAIEGQSVFGIEAVINDGADFCGVASEGFAFDVIALIARGYGVGYAALGLMSALIALEGYRNGTRWAWMIMWVLVLAYAAIAGIFLLAGETYTLSLGVLGIAVIAMVGLLLARKDLSLPTGEMDSLGG